MSAVPQATSAAAAATHLHGGSQHASKRCSLGGTHAAGGTCITSRGGSHVRPISPFLCALCACVRTLPGPHSAMLEYSVTLHSAVCSYLQGSDSDAVTAAAAMLTTGALAARGVLVEVPSIQWLYSGLQNWGRTTIFVLQKIRRVRTILLDSHCRTQNVVRTTMVRFGGNLWQCRTDLAPQSNRFGSGEM